MMRGLRTRILYLILQNIQENNKIRIQEINKAMIIKNNNGSKQIIRRSLLNFINIFNINIKIEKFQPQTKYENLYDKLIIKINKLYRKKDIHQLNEICHLLKDLAISSLHKNNIETQNYLIKKITQ